MPNCADKWTMKNRSGGTFAKVETKFHREFISESVLFLPLKCVHSTTAMMTFAFALKIVSTSRAFEL